MTLGGPVFDSWYSPLRDAAGKITGVIGVAVDITEHTRLSGRLSRRRRWRRSADWPAASHTTSTTS